MQRFMTFDQVYEAYEAKFPFKTTIEECKFFPDFFNVCTLAS